MPQVLILVIGCFVGAVLTYLLREYGVSPVVSSCLVGLGGALVGQYLSLPHLSAVIFTGTFVGMTGLEVATLPQISIAGAFAGLLYGMTVNLFSGYGGRLGAIAFISVIVCVYFFSILKKRTTMKLFS